MGAKKLQEIQGSTDLGIVAKVKRGKDKRSNDGRNPDPLTNDSKYERGSANILAKLDRNDEAKQKKGKRRFLEEISDDIKVNRGSNFVAAELSKVSSHEIDEHRKEDSRLNSGKKLASSATFFDEGTSCSENRVIDESVKERREYKKEQKKEKKKRKLKGITNVNSLKNASAEKGTNLEDEIMHGGSMGSEKDQKRMRKRKGSYRESENSTASTDSCNWEQDKEQDKKIKMKGCFLEHEQDQGSSKKRAKEASEKARKVISGGDTEEVPSRTHISNKDKKRVKENEDVANESYNSELKKDAKQGKKKVSFSKQVEEFPPDQFSHEKSGSDNLVWGKRFTPEEDELIRKSVMNYIEVNQLGEQGLHMILHSNSYRREVKDCWKVITSALPWRPHVNTFFRAHVLFERSEERKWEPEELELLKRYYAEHGPKWRKLADILGKSRVHVKDAWRRIRLPNLKKGKWSQAEYQSLFDLVNKDLRMKAFEKKKDTHSVLKDNISWEAISTKLSTRGSHTCCTKWYFQLASTMVQEGNWNNLDDYKLIEALQKADACCFEEVDWDNLLGHRSGEICQKRWHEMIRHLDKFWVMPFIEQVDLLSERYCPDMIECREMNQNKNHVS